jgi:hypothetical protein
MCHQAWPNFEGKYFSSMAVWCILMNVGGAKTWSKSLHGIVIQ